MYNRSLILSAIFLFNFLGIALAQDKKADPVILTIAGENIPKSEFERVFKKNNTKETNFDKKAVADYVELYINYKLKVREALELGMDTVQTFKDELSGYRKQLAQPYLVDKDVNESLLKEAYNRMKIDLRCSHILIKCEPGALPKDTIEAYNKAIKVRGELLKGADFAATARKYSDDPSAKENAGDLGYFSAMQMVYPFETAAYNTKLGEISMPVRTRFGYHLVKVVDRRDDPGEVKVAQIMVKSLAGAKAEDSAKAVQKINEIYTKLKAGEKFEDLASQFSDDQPSAKKGGVMQSFGTGRMVPEFENAAFALSKPGDFTEPVRTSIGWHIIKLIEKKPVGTYEELQADLKQRVQKDSRSELGRSSMVNRVKSKYGFKENPKAIEEVTRTADTTLLQGKWTTEKIRGMNATVFTLGNKVYTQQDLGNFISDHQTRRGNATVPQVLATNMYNDMVSESAIEYEETKLDSLYPDFRNLMQEYRDGILLFELTDKKVWSKAVKDTAGLRDFYARNKTNYMWGERIDADIFTAANSAIAAQVRKEMKQIDDLDTLQAKINKTSQLNLQIKSGKFSKGENEIIDKLERKTGLTKDMEVDHKIVFVNVKQIIPAQPKSLEEAKGLITADYQNELEKEWIKSLRAKYPVVVNKEVVDSIASK